MAEFHQASSDLGFANDGGEASAFQRLVARPEWLLISEGLSEQAGREKLASLGELGLRADHLALRSRENPVFPKNVAAHFGDYRHILVLFGASNGALVEQIVALAPQAACYELPIDALLSEMTELLRTTPRCC